MISSNISYYLIILLPVLLYWLYWRRRHSHLLKLASVVPGPPALPFIGNAFLFMAKPEEQLNKIANLTQKYGQYVKFWLGPDLNICVKNPEDVRILLTSNKLNQKGPVYNYMLPFIGPGILTGGPTWRANRKIVKSSYNKKTVKTFTAVFNREGELLASVLAKKDPSITFNVYFDVVRSTTQSVCRFPCEKLSKCCFLRNTGIFLYALTFPETLLGLSKEESENIVHLDEIIYNTQRMYALIYSKMTQWWLRIPFIYWWSGKKAEEKHFIQLIDGMTSHILEMRKKRKDAINDNSFGIVERFILGGLSEKEIKEETFTVFTASQEASAKIASAVLLFLAHLPEWQNKVINEIMEVLGPNDDFITEEQLKKLHYLDMVYKEVLRSLPIAGLIQRTVEEDITINNGQITLPAGTSLVVPLYDILHDSQYWDDPQRIKPERFLPENVKKRDPDVFIPFSLGPMDCLGRFYATVLIKTLVVKVVRKVEFEADGKLEDLHLHNAISVKFANGYNLRARPRKLNHIINSST